MSTAEQPVEQKPHQEPADASGSQQQEENKEECGWCRWMKAGGCKSEFEVWLKCVDDVRDAGREDVETCSSVMGPLWECMSRNNEYYAVQLDTLRAQKEAAAKDSGNSAEQK